MSRKLRVAVTAGDAARRGALLRIVEESGHAVATPDAADVVLAERDAADEPTRTLLLTDAPEGDAAGVLPRLANAAQIDAGIRAVAAGLTVRAAAGGAVLNGFHPEEERALPLLTPREIEILSAVGEGMSNKEVARRLGISGHTVKFHLEAVFAKLDAATRAEAVAKGLRRGLIEI
jgi:DNA-binding NarL/FixJ family response regulator